MTKDGHLYVGLQGRFIIIGVRDLETDDAREVYLTFAQGTELIDLITVAQQKVGDGTE